MTDSEQVELMARCGRLSEKDPVMTDLQVGVLQAMRMAIRQVHTLDNVHGAFDWALMELWLRTCSVVEEELVSFVGGILQHLTHRLCLDYIQWFRGCGRSMHSAELLNNWLKVAPVPEFVVGHCQQAVMKIFHDQMPGPVDREQALARMLMVEHASKSVVCPDGVVLQSSHAGNIQTAAEVHGAGACTATAQNQSPERVPEGAPNGA